MDLTCLLLFSISVALLGLYQTVPLADISREDLRRMFGITGPGDSNRIGPILGVTVPQAGPEPISGSSLSEQELNEPTTLVPHTFASTCSRELQTLASITIPIPTRTASTVIPMDTNSAPGAGIPQDQSSWYNEALDTVKQLANSSIPKARDFAFMVCFTLCTAALLGVVGATLTIVYAVFTACKKSASDFVRKAQIVSLDIDQLEAEAQRRQTHLREKLDGIAETIVAEQEAVSKRLRGLRAELDDAAGRARAATDALHRAASDMQDQYLPFPTRDELLSTDLQKYRASLDAAAEDLAGEIATVKSLVPDFRRDFERAATTLRQTELGGTLRKTLKEEKQKARRAVRALREAREGLPSLTDLAEEAERAREDVGGVKESLSQAVKDSNLMLQEMPGMREHLGQAKRQAGILRLKEDLAISQLAYLTPPTTSEGENSLFCTPVVGHQENEYSLLDLNPVEVEIQEAGDIPADLEQELLLLLPDAVSDDDNGNAEKKVDEGGDTEDEKEQTNCSSGWLFGETLRSPELERDTLYEDEEEQRQGKEETSVATTSKTEGGEEEDYNRVPLHLPRLASRGRQRLRWEEMSEEEVQWCAERRVPTP